MSQNEFVYSCSNVIDWMHHQYPESLIDANADKYIFWDWQQIAMWQTLSDKFIDKYADKLCWYSISNFQKLSEDMIEKYQHKMYWRYISMQQKLSESFIEKHADKVDWTYISQYQKLSESFINKYINKVNKHFIIYCQFHLSPEYINYLKNLKD